MKRKWVVVNIWTGLICFDGQKFWTAKGAERKRARMKYWASLTEVRELR